MSSITLVAKSKLPTPWGIFTLVGFQETGTGKDHAALVMGDIADGEPVLGRIHSECLTGDALFSLRCDCGFQLQAAPVLTCQRRPLNPRVTDAAVRLDLQAHRNHRLHVQATGQRRVVGHVALCAGGLNWARRGRWLLGHAGRQTGGQTQCTRQLVQALRRAARREHVATRARLDW